MLKYFYVLDYSVCKCESPNYRYARGFDLRARVYALVEKYGIKGLKTTAAERFEDAEMSCEVPGSEGGHPTLRILTEWLGAVKYVYESTPQSDRNCVIGYSCYLRQN